MDNYVWTSARIQDLTAKVLVNTLSREGASCPQFKIEQRAAKVVDRMYMYMVKQN